jgi:exosortase A-associated hydrolase 1
MREMIDFICSGDRLIGTLHEGAGTTGLMIISGGNEIRSGAYAGQAAMARHFAENGHPVFRYDRRGIGDSEGVNGGFENSAGDLAAAIAAFRAHAPYLERVVAFGNCDAASALALFHAGLDIDRLVLANPWVIETQSEEGAPTQPGAAAIRARYWARLKNPRNLIDLLTGKVDLGKLAGGLKRAAQKEAPSGLAGRIAAALSSSGQPAHILIAARDTTARAFMGSWKIGIFEELRNSKRVSLTSFDTASHSFADPPAKAWLYAQIAEALAEG